MNKGLKIFLIITAVLLSAGIFWSINGPLQFNKERDGRYTSVVAQLQDIGSLQKEYLVQTGKFTGSIDSLIAFADTAVYVIKERKDTTIYTRNVQGIRIPKDEVIYRVVARIPLKDSIFDGRDYSKLGIKQVGDKKPIHMDVHKTYTLNKDSTSYTTNYFFKAYSTKREILDGLSENYIMNEIEEGKGIVDTVLSIGSLVIPSTEGNWTPELDYEAVQLKKKEVQEDRAEKK